MRLVHRNYPWKAAIFALCAVWLGAAVPALALTIASPTEGQIVRDRVPIVVPRSSLPANVASSGFLVVKIDGRFRSAVGVSTTQSGGKSPASPNVVYVWDTKDPMKDPALPEDQRHYRDGRREITVEAHGRDGKKDVLVETAKVNVVLQNRVPMSDPAPPLRLNYRYRLGEQNVYKVTVAGEMLNTSGYSLTGGQPAIQGQFDVMEVVEDARADGTALLRYKVEKTAFAQVYGQINMLGQSGQPFRSVFKILDISGKTLEANVFSFKSTVEVTDCLVRLPGRPVQVGESWPTVYRLRLEGLCDLTEFTGTSKLEALEWESGFECAKIVSKLTGSPKFAFLPQGSPIGAVNATSTAYFAVKPGKLIKQVIVMEFSTSVDSSTLASIQQQMTIPSSSSTMASSGMPMPGVGAMPVPMPGPSRAGSSATSMPTPGMPAPGRRSMPSPVSSGSSTGMDMGTVTTTAPTTTVRYRLVAVGELRG